MLNRLNMLYVSLRFMATENYLNMSPKEFTVPKNYCDLTQVIIPANYRKRLPLEAMLCWVDYPLSQVDTKVTLYSWLAYPCSLPVAPCLPCSVLSGFLNQIVGSVYAEFICPMVVVLGPKYPHEAEVGHSPMQGCRAFENWSKNWSVLRFH